MGRIMPEVSPASISERFILSPVRNEAIMHTERAKNSQ